MSPPATPNPTRHEEAEPSPARTLLRAYFNLS